MALKHFYSNCAYFGFSPIALAYFIAPTLLLTTLIICCSLVTFTALLAYLTVRIQKNLTTLGSFDFLKLIIFKFLGAGFIFLVFYVLDYNTKPFAILFMTSYFIQTTLFALFLGKLNQTQTPANQ